MASGRLLGTLWILSPQVLYVVFKMLLFVVSWLPGNGILTVQHRIAANPGESSHVQVMA